MPAACPIDGSTGSTEALRIQVARYQWSILESGWQSAGDEQFVGAPTLLAPAESRRADVRPDPRRTRQSLAALTELDDPRRLGPGGRRSHARNRDTSRNPRQLGPGRGLQPQRRLGPAVLGNRRELHHLGAGHAGNTRRRGPLKPDCASAQHAPRRRTSLRRPQCNRRRLTMALHPANGDERRRCRVDGEFEFGFTGDLTFDGGELRHLRRRGSPRMK